MSRTRGHVIAKVGDKFIQYYLAYNANTEWMLKVLAIDPQYSATYLSSCGTGIAQFNERGIPYEYHDYNKLDHLAHDNREFATFEEALAACTLPHIYIWDGNVWTHQTLEESVSAEQLLKVRPLKRRKNVWRDARKAREAAEDVKAESVEESVEVEGSQPE